MSISFDTRKQHIYTSIVNFSAQKLDNCFREAEVPEKVGMVHSKKVLDHMM